ncbi:MAG: GNAT family N-acetyltransferase [Thermoleophilia bacterium]
MDRVKCTIRARRDDDRSMLVLLAEETLHPLAEGAGHPERYRTAEFLELVGRADVFVAEAEGVMAGFIAVEAEEDTLALRCICVSPAFEGRGVANQLVDWAEGLAIDHRLRRLTAHVPAADHPSRHLYKGHDFVPAGQPGEPDMLVLEKRLPGSVA